METVDLPDKLFPQATTICIAGPTGSGKTSLTMQIIEHKDKLFEEKVHGVVYCYSEYQDLYKEKNDIIFHYGLPTAEDIQNYIELFKGHQFLLVIDDLMDRMTQSDAIRDVLTKKAHHGNFTIITILQNLFPQGKAARTQSLNYHFIFCLRTCRELRQLNYLASQMFPGKTSSFMQIYKDAVDSDHMSLMKSSDNIHVPYLLIICHPLRTQRDCMLFTNVIPPDDAMIMYKV